MLNKLAIEKADKKKETVENTISRIDLKREGAMDKELIKGKSIMDENQVNELKRKYKLNVEITNYYYNLIIFADQGIVLNPIYKT